jgi:hypothetical protein
LSAYVSGVFFGSYKDTSKEMKRYYEEPLRTHKVLMIERIADVDKNPGFRSELVVRLLETELGASKPEAPQGDMTSVSSDADQ